MRGFLALGSVATIVAATVMSACSGGADDPFKDSDDGGTDPVTQAITPYPGGLRKLTGRQYVGTMRALFNDAVGDLAQQLVDAADPPFDQAVQGFHSIGAAQLSYSQAAVDQLEGWAGEIADAVVSDPELLDELLPCTPTGPSDAECHRSFVESFGRLAWRRSLTADEITQMVDVAQAAATDPDVNDFNQGVKYALSAFLQSPHFVYIVELGRDDAEDPNKRPLTPLELATRMSFFLLDRTPDAKTLDTAEENGLDTEEEIRALAESMVARPEAKAALSGFYAEIYRLNELTTVTKDPDLYPLWSPALAQSMKEETLRLVEDVIWTRNADAREIFDADYTFVDAQLAALYGVAAPAQPWSKITLPNVQRRAGLLGHASFAARQSTALRTSPTRRGLFIQSVLLCTEIPPPPPGVDTTLPDDTMEQLTVKEKLLKHVNDPQCANCHSRIDPLGFAVENYDAIGAFRTTDNGKPIDSTGEVEGIGSFEDARSLAAILRNDPRGAACIVKNLFKHSMGHLETKGELAALEALEESFEAAEYRVQRLLVDLVASPAFRLVGPPK